MDAEWLQEEVHVRLKLKAVQIRHESDVAIDGAIQDHVADGTHAAREKLPKVVEPAMMMKNSIMQDQCLRSPLLDRLRGAPDSHNSDAAKAAELQMLRWAGLQHGGKVGSAISENAISPECCPAC